MGTLLEWRSCALRHLALQQHLAVVDALHEFIAACLLRFQQKVPHIECQLRRSLEVGGLLAIGGQPQVVFAHLGASERLHAAPLLLQTIDVALWTKRCGELAMNVRPSAILQHRQIGIESLVLDDCDVLSAQFQQHFLFFVRPIGGAIALLQTQRYIEQCGIRQV